MIQTVAITIHEGVQALDVAGPADVFSEANALIASNDRYKIQLIAASSEPIRASNGTRLIADATFAEARCSFDILLVAGGPTLPDAQPDQRIIEWVGDAPKCGGIYGSICTGAFTLGHAGLLDGKRATSHWLNVGKLAVQFPNAHIEPDAIFVQDGSLVSSAGITAGIDLSLALVRQRHGSKIAVAIAKKLVVVAQRQGGQSQFSPYLMTAEDPSSPVARLQAYVLANIGLKHSLESMAAEVEMSPRNLSRYFMKEAGITAHEFVNLARIDAARMQLEMSNLPLKTIAYQCGFSSAEHMRLIFNEKLHITPARYRTSFQHPPPN